MKQIAVYTSTGRTARKIALPGELFGQKASVNLLTQAFHIYQAKTHKGTHKTKTRAEARGTTAKWYRQKGTGRARHGARTAPIFVGGGIAHGPKGLKRTIKLSKKQARVALLAALSDRLFNNKVVVIDAEKVSGKTKIVAQLFKKIGVVGKALVLHGKEEGFVRGVKNLPKLTLLPANLVNAYEVVRHPLLVITKAGLELMKKTFLKENQSKKLRKEEIKE